MDTREAPAIVRGSELRGLAINVNDSHGDLIDIEFFCIECAEDRQIIGDALPWPAYQFGDYDTCCMDCGAVINKGTED